MPARGPLEDRLPPSRPNLAIRSRRRRLAASLIGLCCALSLAAVPAGAVPRPPTEPGVGPSASAGWRTLTYGAARFLVPAGWPILDLSADPTACARFDRHAIYLGAQGLQAECPAGLVGRTEAVQVQPPSDRAIEGSTFGPTTVLGSEPARLTRSSGASRSLTASFPRLGVVMTATWGDDRAVAETIAESFRPALVVHPIVAPPTDTLPEDGSTQVTAPTSRIAVQTATATASGYVGPGFDACTAPSLSSMRAWLSSSYRAIGIYVGGTNRACSQANLTPSWVSTVEGMGWNLAPLYVGLQAPCASQQNLASISSTNPGPQGRRAADDAVGLANGLGLGVGTPIYFDMEAYDSSKRGCDRTVERFLSAWIDELHEQRYVAGVYGSAGSTIAELVKYADSSHPSPNDIWFAHWNGTPSIFGDPYIPDSLWANHQRLHQYLGGHVETYGGVSINIDSSQVDGAVVGRPAEGSFVRTLSGRKYRIAGGAPFPVQHCATLGGCRPIETLSSMRSLPRYPADRSVITAAETGRTYVAAGDAALPVDECVPNARCSRPVELEATTIVSLGGGHLRRYPTNGTELQGSPSGDLWRLRNGCRWPRSTSTSEVGVPDTTIDAMFPPCVGTLAFEAGRAGRRHLFTMRSDGTHRSRLTSGTADDVAPAISPDGTRVAFTRTVNGNADVWVTNLDGTGLTRLTRNRAFDGYPSWSPDGGSIAFESDRAGSPDVWTMGADGTGLQQLTRRRSSDGRPAWSPDGGSIAFRSDRAGSFHIWTISPTGDALTQVTSGRGNDTNPSWSPDGASIAFQSDRSGDADIWTVGSDGGGRAQLTRRRASDRTPTWSPDGGRIAFVSTRDGAPQVFVMHADGRVVLRYTLETSAAGHPRWSPS